MGVRSCVAPTKAQRDVLRWAVWSRDLLLMREDPEGEAVRARINEATWQEIKFDEAKQALRGRIWTKEQAEELHSLVTQGTPV